MLMILLCDEGDEAIAVLPLFDDGKSVGEVERRLGSGFEGDEAAGVDTCVLQECVEG